MELEVGFRDVIGLKVISKKFKLNSICSTKFRKVGDVGNKEKRTENGSLWDPTDHIFLAEKGVIDFYCEFSIG
jgi:hypothetical protein